MHELLHCVSHKPPDKAGEVTIRVILLAACLCQQEHLIILQ